VSAPARVVFALLVVATFAAFFVAQRLKHSPTVLQQVTGALVFSPNGDGRQDVLRVGFQLKRADVISVDVIDQAGDPLRSLADGRRLAAHKQVVVRWNGRDDQGRRVPDGRYRLEVTLRDESRTVVIRHDYRVDTVPPVPRIVALDPPHGSGPELLPNATRRVVVHTAPAGAAPEVLIFRTSFGAPRQVARLAVSERTAVWDGRIAGAPAPAGTYVAVARWRDRAGNVGSSVPLDPRTHAPVLRYGERFAPGGGITVRYLEVQPPTMPTAAGKLFPVGVDARGARYAWDLRALGTVKPIRHGVTRRTPLKLSAPRGRSGLYLFEVRAGGRTASVPIAVNGTSTGKVLVVLPMMTWQGRNPVDDDGDGAPDLLDRGVSVRSERVFARGRLPAGFRDQEGPLLAFLARHHRSFDITTDIALAAGRGPGLAGHHGVILPGDVRWLPRALQLSLRDYVRRGGTLLLTGTDSLRREVTPARDGTLRAPTPAAPTNLFGTRLRSVVTEPTSLTSLKDDIGLFTGGVYGGTGTFTGYRGHESTAGLGREETLAANAVTPDGQSVLVAARFGRGLETRTGLLDFATRLKTDGNAAALVLRAWSLLAG